MLKLEELTQGARVCGVVADGPVTIVAVLPYATGTAVKVHFEVDATSIPRKSSASSTTNEATSSSG